MNDVGIDELFPLRNSFLTGNYASLLHDLPSYTTATTAANTRRDAKRLLWRSLLALGRYDTLLRESDEHGDGALVILQHLANVAKNPGGKATDAVVQELRDIAESHDGQQDATLLLLKATAFWRLDRMEEAFYTLSRHQQNLECMAMIVQMYLSLQRLDLAAKELSRMKSISDDATVTQLAEAWVCLSQGAEKAQEAMYIFQDLAETQDRTSMLLNGQALCLLTMGKASEAEGMLQESLSKNPNDADSIANLSLCESLLGRNDGGQAVISDMLSRISNISSSHPLVVDLALKGSLFDRSAEKLLM